MKNLPDGVLQAITTTPLLGTDLIEAPNYGNYGFDAFTDAFVLSNPPVWGSNMVQYVYVIWFSIFIRIDMVSITEETLVGSTKE